MDTTLLTALVKKYEKLMDQEKVYRGYVARSDIQDKHYLFNLPKRPSKSEVKSTSLLIRKEALALDNKFEREYWGV